jgi:hypothetical protein
MKKVYIATDPVNANLLKSVLESMRRNMCKAQYGGIPDGETADPSMIDFP